MDIQQIIEQRIEAIKSAHASNKIEGSDMGEQYFVAMLERAKEPISNEEFAQKELALARLSIVR